MNFLAHAYLSFNEPEILVGNMTSDFIKGKRKLAFSEGVQKGIALHRTIDQFTDGHPATQFAKSYFRPAYRLYSGAFVDVVYDHFLATDANEFIFEDSLEIFSKQVYQTLEDHFFQLPENFQRIFPFMKMQDWLNSYRYIQGIKKSFGGLVHRAAYMAESDTAFSIFNEHYEELKNCYEQFFPEQKKFAARQLRNLLDP